MTYMFAEVLLSIHYFFILCSLKFVLTRKYPSTHEELPITLVFLIGNGVYNILLLLPHQAWEIVI